MKELTEDFACCSEKNNHEEHRQGQMMAYQDRQQEKELATWLKKI